MNKGVPGFQGARLTQAREAMGLTQTSLADLIGVSKQAVSQYERFADSPTAEVLDRIRATLRHEHQFFLTPPADLATGVRFFRSMAAATKRARKKAETWGIWTRELINYITCYIQIPQVNVPTFDVPSNPNELSMSDIDGMAADLRTYWGLRPGPIANLCATAEANGIWVVRHPMDAETLDGFSEWLRPEGFPLVILNADKRVAVRSRLDLAHEIGHIVIHRLVPPELLNRSDQFRLIEDQAFRFGAALLVPERDFLEDIYSLSLDALRAMKPKWKVSIAMMIEWLKHYGMLSDDQHRRLRINYASRKWNRNEPLDDELVVEEPTFIRKAVGMLVDDGLDAQQIAADTGFSKEWLEKLLALSPTTLSPTNGPEFKIVEFKQRA